MFAATLKAPECTCVYSMYNASGKCERVLSDSIFNSC